jgi:hypothetical protein
VRSSDHKPLWVRFISTQGHHTLLRQFKFEASCNTNAKCAKVIKFAWAEEVDGVNSMEATKVKLEHCQQALLAWSSTKYRTVGRSLKLLTKRLMKL